MKTQSALARMACRLAAVGAGLAATAALITPAIAQNQQQAKKPNILVIWGDDVGQTNLSTYGLGVVGYQTPNIDRLANEGAKFTDYYAENSCTAGRATFITGQSCLRTGLSKVGLPGAPVGLQKSDITIAQALKPLGYSTGQFGKNHLGDKDEYLPTNHGFDEFFGNLYHLNAEEEPERPYWDSTDPDFRKIASPRGVLKCTADGKIVDTGPLTRKRMETIDDETTAACIDFMQRQTKAGKPFFTWMNFTRMHVFTHVRESMRGQSGMVGNEYADGMIEMDMNVGKILKALEEMGIDKDTIVVFSTDNGPNQFTWPDAATTPFRNEKDSNWEGAFRVPAIVRWPGRINPGLVLNGIMSGLDWFPTFLAAAGDTTIKDRLLKGWQPDANPQKFRNHLDGYNQLDWLTGAATESARKEFAYFNDDGDLVGFRYKDWKIVLSEMKSPGGFSVWREPFTNLRIPKLFNLRMDPYERADISSDQNDDFFTKNVYVCENLVMRAEEFLMTFAEYPPSQRPASFNVSDVRAKVNKVMEKHFQELEKQPQQK